MKGIIFDFNGTMFFDEEFQNKAWKTFVKQKTGRDISDDEFQEYIHGRNADVSLPYLLQRNLTKQEVMDLEEEKELIYRRLCLESRDFKLADGLPRFLDDLTAAEIPHTIATASALANVRFFFENLNLYQWFRLEDVIYNDGTIPGKPEPDIYLRAADAIQVDISDCVIFEDAKSGIESAKRAGAGKIVGVASMLDDNTLLDLGASMTIADYKDLDLLHEIEIYGGQKS
ncbi:MAG: HAD family phosphatase [Lachnospiraceae bacterium]|nr:HAD family phosphatase [Lachnospiraceae bacterium]